MKSLVFTFLFSLYSLLIFSQASNIQSPFQYFNYYGKHHTPHHRVIEYLQYIDNISDRITMEKYGETNQGRPMYSIFISSPTNLSQKEDIRLTNLSQIGLSTLKPQHFIEKPIIWCSFGVHGNEAGTTESVMNIVYTLASSTDSKVVGWLDKALIIIDPSLNPDGYDRYTHFLHSTTGDQLHPNRIDQEHQEPWPTGRYNHYLYDLNRDWAWQTQVESQQRNAVYNRWMPQIHADFHEMGINEGYFFAPSAEPFHAFIADYQRDFHNRMGKNHISYFDKNGWLYYTREVFDLFYPSYGDTYPTYNGAIGMTYEQAGNSSSGRTVMLDNGDTLTILDKINHNTVVALSTIEVGADQGDDLLKGFKKFFQDSRIQPKGKYKTYVFKKHSANQRLANLLDKTGIEYGFATKSTKQSGAYKYGTKEISTIEVNKGDLIIQAHQPKSVMLQILMEEEAKLQDSLTYDITAWALPFAYGNDCFGFTNVVNIETDKMTPNSTLSQCDGNHYAYAMNWDDLSKAQILAKLHAEGIKVRMAIKESKFGNVALERGTIVANRFDNLKVKDFDQKVKNILASTDGCLCLKSGFADGVGDLGGNSFQLIKVPKVLTFNGEGVATNSAGELWHYFDRTIKYPISIINWANFNRADLNDYNTIILPDGYYSIDPSKGKALSEWAKKGGRLIFIGNTVSKASSIEGLSFEKHAVNTEKTKEEEQDSLVKLAARFLTYEGMDRRSISKSTAGAIVKNKIDDSHPLGFGIGKEYYSLKTSDSVFAMQKNQWNVGYVPKGYFSTGFIGVGLKKKLEESVTFSATSIGSGQVIYLVDNPLFRGFWDKGLLLFANAVFLNGTISDNY